MLAYCFDSILVRLKGYFSDTHDIITRKFRFHTGSIKRLRARAEQSIQSGFDSILVRLKVDPTHIADEVKHRFDSILVRLKAQHPQTPLQMSEHRFDSILVRLKAEYKCWSQRPQFLSVSIPYWFD